MVNVVQSVVQCLKLTQWGEIFVTAFPEEALIWANGHFFSSTIRAADPFKKFTKLCLDWCNQTGNKPSWAEMYRQQRMFGQPTNAPMYVPNPPKGKASPSGESSATCPQGQPTVPLAENEVLISGLKYRILSVTETEARQAEFLNNADCVAGIDKLARLMGVQSANAYVRRVFDNLKFEQVVDD